MTLYQRIIMTGKLFFRLIRVFFQMIYGAWRISKLPQPIISIFGGSRLSLDNPYAIQAHDLANRFVGRDISVLTGGGPGIMQAANCGAVNRNKLGTKRSIGIGVRDLGEEKNKCVEEYFELDYFFARKWLLTRYSVGVVVFPGGFGTLDELSELLTLIQMKRIDRIPIVLIGVDYWDDFMAWVRKEAFKHGLIEKEHLELFTLTDSIDEAFDLMNAACRVKWSPHEYTKE